MNALRVRRLLVTPSVGVGDRVSNATTVLRILVRTFLRGSTADKAAMERAGGVRIPDPATGTKANKIARADPAAWLVAQLNNIEHVHRVVTVATS